MRNKNSFIINAIIIAVAVFAIVALILLRVKVTQLLDQKTALEAEMSSYQERIAQLEEELGR